jgi:hypothetical protein
VLGRRDAWPVLGGPTCTSSLLMCDGKADQTRFMFREKRIVS